VVSPGLFDAEALVEKVCRRLAKYCGNREAGLQGQVPVGPANAAVTPQYKLIRCRPIGVRPAVSLAEPDMELMDTLAQICTKHGIKAIVV
jgi:hypothetical protein